MKTHILCSVNAFRKRAMNEIIWKNTVDSGRPLVTIWHIRIASWLLNLLKTKRNLLYIRNQSVPRCKHFQPRL